MTEVHAARAVPPAASAEMSDREVSNDEVATALRQMAGFLEMEGGRFKARAFERAAHAVTTLERPLAQLHREGGAAALDAIPGIGKEIAGRISGMLSSGSMAELEHLRHETPIDVLDMTAIEGIGPRRARELYRWLGVRSLVELERAASDGRIRSLPHWGERSEQRILQALALHLEAAGAARSVKR